MCVDRWRVSISANVHYDRNGLSMCDHGRREDGVGQNPGTGPFIQNKLL